MSPEEIKDFDDPLMGRMDRRGPVEKTANRAARDTKSRLPAILLGFGLAAVLATVIYFLYQAQQRIEALNADLNASRQQLETVSSNLQTSQTQIGTLEQGLTESQQQIVAQKQELNRSQRLYTDLKSQQGEQSKELETISIRKADQSQVDALKDETGAIQGQVGELNSRMAQANSNISDLREMSAKNRGDINSQGAELEQVKKSAAANADEIAGVKRSLDREYYNFELQKKGGVMKVFEVALSLKDIDFKKQNYDIEILADGQRLRKKDVNINEPIFFYVKGLKKPYEVLVNRVDKNFVVGYLSVPKS